MKQIYLLLLLSLCSLVALAQEQKSTPEQKVDKKLKEVTDVLTLSADQQKTLKEALLTRYKAQEAYKLKNPDNKKGYKEEAEKLKNAYQNVFKKTLTKEQLKQWEKYKEEEKKKEKAAKEKSEALKSKK